MTFGATVGSFRRRGGVGCTDSSGTRRGCRKSTVAGPTWLVDGRPDRPLFFLFCGGVEELDPVLRSDESLETRESSPADDWESLSSLGPAAGGATASAAGGSDGSRTGGVGTGSAAVLSWAAPATTMDSWREIA